MAKVIPQTWVIDPVKLPPNAVLDAPYVNGKPLTNWSGLIDASQKERNMIIKISGFHEKLGALVVLPWVVIPPSRVGECY